MAIIGEFGPTILQHPLVVEIILPFLLIFTIVFAILQKSKLFGDGKRQIDAIVALVVGLLFVAFANAVDLVINLIPFLGIGLVLILIFFLLWGFTSDGKIGGGVKKALGIIALIAVVGVVLLVTGWWNWIYDFFVSGAGTPNVVTNIIVIVIAAAAIAFVVWGGGSGGSTSSTPARG